MERLNSSSRPWVLSNRVLRLLKVLQSHSCTADAGGVFEEVVSWSRVQAHLCLDVPSTADPCRSSPAAHQTLCQNAIASLKLSRLFTRKWQYQVSHGFSSKPERIIAQTTGLTQRDRTCRLLHGQAAEGTSTFTSSSDLQNAEVAESRGKRRHPRIETVMPKGRGGTGLGLSVLQKRVGSKVRTALAGILADEEDLREKLVDELGFSILEVRMVPDLQRAYIRWSSDPGCEKAVEAVLVRQNRRLRNLLFRRLQMRRAPELEFRLDTLDPEMAAVDEAFAKIEAERRAMEKSTS